MGLQLRQGFRGRSREARTVRLSTLSPLRSAYLTYFVLDGASPYPPRQLLLQTATEYIVAPRTYPPVNLFW